MLEQRADWGGGSRVGIRRPVLEELRLKCLLNMQVEMPSRSWMYESGAQGSGLNLGWEEG